MFFCGDLESVNSHIDAVTIWSLNTGLAFYHFTDRAILLCNYSNTGQNFLLPFQSLEISILPTVYYRILT